MRVTLLALSCRHRRRRWGRRRRRSRSRGRCRSRSRWKNVELELVELFTVPVCLFFCNPRTYHIKSHLEWVPPRRGWDP